MTSDLSGIERAIFGTGATRDDVESWLTRHVRHALGLQVAQLLFTTGRVSAVYGLRLTDGRSIVAKVHRCPLEIDGLRAAQDVQRLLWTAGFPCPEPMGSALSTDSHTATLEALVVHAVPGDGRDIEVRAELAAGLARQVAIIGG